MQESRFFETLNKKTVIVTLNTGEKLAGVISCNSQNSYDIVVEGKDSTSWLIPKAGILKIQFSGGQK